MREKEKAASRERESGVGCLFGLAIDVRQTVAAGQKTTQDCDGIRELRPRAEGGPGRASVATRCARDSVPRTAVASSKASLVSCLGFTVAATTEWGNIARYRLTWGERRD